MTRDECIRSNHKYWKQMGWSGCLSGVFWIFEKQGHEFRRACRYRPSEDILQRTDTPAYWDVWTNMELLDAVDFIPIAKDHYEVLVHLSQHY